MKIFQQKISFKNFLYSTPFLIFLGILVLFFVFGIITFLNKMKIVRENKIIAENKLSSLEEEKKRLIYNISELNTEEGKEANIRERFALAKDGEGLIVIVEEKEKLEEENISSSGFFSFIKNLFR